jgi:hypothetical protein
MVSSAEPEQRFDVDGREVLQVRGRIVDSSKQHPQVVVRFGGQRRAELYRWARAGLRKHLAVDGYLEVKVWTGSNGKQRVALLIDALNISPLNEPAQDLSKAGIYANGRSNSAAVSSRPAGTKAERAAQVRRLMESDARAG